MSDEEIEKYKEAIINIASEIYKIIKPIIIKVWNEIKNILKSIIYRDNEIKKRINIANRTKSYRIRKKQQKLIVRGMQLYFI